MSDASNFSMRSYFAPGSEGKVFQYETAFDQFLPLGINCLSFMYLYVFSSGAIIPPRAPISMLILQIVILDSIDKSAIVLPAYSTKYPVPPDVVNFAIM